MFRYDREGRMVFHVDRNGNQVLTTYNVDGNPVLERACDRIGEHEVTRSWEYDEEIIFRTDAYFQYLSGRQEAEVINGCIRQDSVLQL